MMLKTIKALPAFLFLSLIFCSLEGRAFKFKGYSNDSTMRTVPVSGPIVRFKETKENFLILISIYPAFYSFPKNKISEVEVRDFLKKRSESKKPLLLTTDPMTARIFYIEDSK